MAQERIKKGDAGLLPWIAAGVLLALALGLGAYFFFREVSPEPTARPVAFGTYTAYTGPKLAVTLYFPSPKEGVLMPQVRDVPQVVDEVAQLKLVVEELIRGPQEGLVPSFPSGTRVKGVYLDDKGTAYVNFSRELQVEYPGGAWTETLTIYSLVNTLCANFPDDVKAVQILVEGKETPTLAGHIDTSRPFAPRPTLNRG